MGHTPAVAHCPATVKSGVMVGWTRHVVGHHIDEIQVFDKVTVVVIARTRRRGHGEQQFVAQGVAQVAHQEGVVALLVRGRDLS